MSWPYVGVLDSPYDRFNNKTSFFHKRYFHVLISYLWTCDERRLGIFNRKYHVFLTLFIGNPMKDLGSRSQESGVLPFDHEHGVPATESLAHEDN